MRDSGAAPNNIPNQPAEDAGKPPLASGGSGGSKAATCTKTESECSNQRDDDCDGFVDCLDPDCESKTCDTGGSTCIAGACLKEAALPALPTIENLVLTVRGDTAIVDFSPVKGALDYRIYPLPAKDDILVGKAGEVTIRNAIYRCAGALPRDDRGKDQVNRLALSLAGVVEGYTRTEAESVLGHVFVSPAAGRKPIYRVANPNSVGGYPWEYDAPPAKEYNGADYVSTTQARDALVAKGWRDDGIAFYVPEDATRSIYYREYAMNGTSVLYTDGAEKTARDAQSGTAGSEHFKVLDAEADGTVPLYRVFYSFHNDHDTLAAGEAQRDRVLHQGNIPITALSWPGLKGETTLVIEALDTGCPFPNGFINASAAPAATLGVEPSPPTITLEQARLNTSETYLNGQYEPSNRPKPIARAYVTVQPKAKPEMDWFESFDPDVSLAPFDKLVDDNNGTRVFRNDKLDFEFVGANANYAFGPLLGQLAVGSASTFGIAAVNANAKLSDDRYLHVTMTADVVSTNRRYPQVFITDAPLGDLSKDPPGDIPFIRRLGPLPFEKVAPGKYHTLVVQTFSSQPELQVQLCDLRGWGVNAQCPKANLYGYHAGMPDAMLDWTKPWLPLPVLGEYAGLDRLVKFDIYATTKRVYVFLDDRPAGCAVLPEGRFPSGPVNVVFGAAAYHIDVDETLVRPPSRFEYWTRYSLAYTDRRFDDLGVKNQASLPSWDETRIPCGTQFYGGSQ